MPQLNRSLLSEREARAAVESEKRLVLIELEAKQARLSDMMTAAQVGAGTCGLGAELSRVGLGGDAWGGQRPSKIRQVCSPHPTAPPSPRSGKPRRLLPFARRPTYATAS